MSRSEKRDKIVGKLNDKDLNLKNGSGELKSKRTSRQTNCRSEHNSICNFFYSRFHLKI